MQLNCDFKYSFFHGLSEKEGVALIKQRLSFQERDLGILLCNHNYCSELYHSACNLGSHS